MIGCTFCRVWSEESLKSGLVQVQFFLVQAFETSVHEFHTFVLGPVRLLLFSGVRFQDSVSAPSFGHTMSGTGLATSLFFNGLLDIRPAFFLLSSIKRIRNVSFGK